MTELEVLTRIPWKGDLYDANPNCDHYVIEMWSGVKCARCPGWFCA